jgi:16S rRNA (adenine1518-N6/adenine1519-N6)-dimethyltransferase
MLMMIKDLTNVAFLKKLFQKEGLGPKHSMGQNFLICSEVLEATIMALEEGPKNITELGAGAGTLTQALLASKFNVRAIERDDELANLLTTLTPKKLIPQLTMVKGDLREEKWGWEKPFSVAGNIPYNLSGLIIKKVTQLEPKPQLVVLLIQREVGERLTAEAPNLSLISVAVRLWGQAEMILNVPADCFYPKPKVDSQLVLLSPNIDSHTSLAERERALKIIKRFFQAKRKQIGGVLKQQFKLSDTDTEKVLRLAKINRKQRPQEILPDQWLLLVSSFEEMGISTH